MPAIAISHAAGSVEYAEHVNPQWVRLLDPLEMNETYERCAGVELFTSEGRWILDFLSGYCVHNVGHNHPAIIAALPLMVTERQLDMFVDAIGAVVDSLQFSAAAWTEVLGLARRAVNI